MKGDFSRSTFDPGKHYSGVRMQQGRVQLDADWNENLDILRRRIETETIDVIGECGVPVHDPGFGVVTSAGGLSKDETDWLNQQSIPALTAGDFYLTQGRAYVDGILLEYDHTLPFSRQPFGLQKGQAIPTAPGLYLLYLDVWERHITAIEDPTIREVALGGPDTATRSQVVWQAVLVPAVDQGKGTTCSSDLAPWPAASTGTLSARTLPVQDPNDPCVVPLGAGYKRLENQLYRVEIHNGSDAAGGPTYKWSRDNGSVVVGVTGFSVGGDATKISVSSLGRDDVLGLHKNDWVEVLDDTTELQRQPGTLVRITNIDSGNVLELSGSVSGYDIDGHPKVRRWDSDGGTGTGLAVTSGYVDLEGGVQVQFDTTGTYRTGDYWLIPARTVPGQYGGIEWPQDDSQNPLALLPFGITHHYCRVGLLNFAADNSGKLGVTLQEDCRKKFPPLTELPSGGENCCSVTVGQGGDYPDLPSALAAQPKDAFGWTICILPGVLSLTDTLAVDAFQGLKFSGCGIFTRLVAPAGKPAFKFTNGSQVTLEGLTIQAASPNGAVLFSQVDAITIADCRVLNSESFGVTDKWMSKFQAVGPAVVIDTGDQVEMHDNDLIGLPAVQANGTQMQILHNSLMGGGIQIIPPSAYVEIADNTIIDGQGPGIRLGGGDKTAADYAAAYYKVDAEVSQPAAKKAKAAAGNAIPVGSYAPKTNQIPAAIKNVTIARNLIGRMAGSGIITDTSLVSPGQLGDVEELSIVENQIVFCSLVPDVTLSAASQVGGGIAAIGLFSTQIRDNFIAGSGFGKQPACGIFILDGSDIEIAGNVVVENGVTEGQEKPLFYQAGIAAQLVFGNFLLNSGGAPLNGYPALRLHDNQVVCPAGQALTVSAIGGVSIDGNTFATRERMSQPSNPLDFGVKGSCVYVLDMGVPVWNPNAALLIQSLLAKQTALHVDDFLSPQAALANFPDGRVLFHNNQVWFNTGIKETVKSLGNLDSQFAQRAWDAATFSAFFFSLDDLSISGNQFQATVPLYLQDLSQSYTQKGLDLGLYFAYLFKFIQVGALGTTIRATGNGLSELFASNYISLDTLAGLMNVTTSNEATHAIVAFGPNPANTAAANNLSLLP